MHLGQVLKRQKILVSNIFSHFLFAVSLGNWASKMSEKIRLDRKIGFQNTFYTKCINVIIDSIGPSIILRSILTVLSHWLCLSLFNNCYLISKNLRLILFKIYATMKLKNDGMSKMNRTPIPIITLLFYNPF